MCREPFQQLAAGSRLPVCPRFWRSDGIPGPTPTSTSTPGVTPTHTDSELGCVTSSNGSSIGHMHFLRVHAAPRKSTCEFLFFSLDTLLGRCQLSLIEGRCWHVGRSVRPPLTSHSQLSPILDDGCIREPTSAKSPSLLIIC